MPTLHVDLREGFQRDTVIVRVDGREVYNRPDVETNYSVGLADRLTAEVSTGTVRVEVLLPRRGLEGSLTIPVTDSATLSFSLDPAGALSGQQVEDSPRYL
jgi:hypothetical protein